MQGKELKDQNIEQGLDDNKISRLSAAIRVGTVGRNSVLYIGWSAGDAPMLSWDANDLSGEAKANLNISKPVKLSGDVSIGDRPLEAVQYLASLPSIDNPDLPDQYTEDIIVFGVANAKAETEYIHIEEMSLMEGILSGHVVWQEVNPHTMLGDQEVIPSLPMHSFLLPVQKDDGKKVLLTMMFAPTLPNESNEPAFKLFLAQTLKSFLALDARQPEGSKKGYESVFNDAQSNEGVGGDAFVIMKTLKDLGLADNITQDRLQQIWRESSGKSFSFQLMLLAREFGFVDFQTTDGQAVKGQIEKMDVDSLMKLMDMCHKVVAQTFRRGKR